MCLNYSPLFTDFKVDEVTLFNKSYGTYMCKFRSVFELASIEVGLIEIIFSKEVASKPVNSE